MGTAILVLTDIEYVLLAKTDWEEERSLTTYNMYPILASALLKGSIQGSHSYFLFPLQGTSYLLEFLSLKDCRAM